MPKPVSRVTYPLEAAIEKQFLRLVKDRRLPVLIRKMNGLGFASWPDRLIIGPQRFSMWIEFKRPVVGKLSEGQGALFSEMGAMGHRVHVFTDAGEALEAVQQALRAYGVAC